MKVAEEFSIHCVDRTAVEDRQLHYSKHSSQHIPTLDNRNTGRNCQRSCALSFLKYYTCMFQ
jgi:hypothetical protein